MSSSNNQYKPVLYFLCFLLLADFISTLTMKYTYNGMNLGYYDYTNIGNNILALVFAVSSIGVVIRFFINKSKTRLFFLLSIILIMQLSLLILAVLLRGSDLLQKDVYLFGYPSEKFYIYVILILRTFLQFYFMALTWLSIINHEKFNILRGIISTVIMGIMLFIFSFLYTQKEVTNNSEVVSNADAAMVLGAAVWKKDKPTPLFEARILKAHDLYKSGKVRRIIVTGSNAPGEITEAEAASKMLLDLGVERKDIKIEKYSRNTKEQLTYLRNNVIEEKVVIISDKFHLARVMEIGEFLQMNFQAIASDYNVGDEKLLFYRMRETFALLLFWLYGI